MSVGDAFRAAALVKGTEEAVGGVVVARYGVSTVDVIPAVKDKIQALQAGLPSGVRIVPFYDRSALIERAVATLRRARVASHQIPRPTATRIASQKAAPKSIIPGIPHIMSKAASSSTRLRTPGWSGACRSRPGLVSHGAPACEAGRREYEPRPLMTAVPGPPPCRGRTSALDRSRTRDRASAG